MFSLPHTHTHTLSHKHYGLPEKKGYITCFFNEWRTGGIVLKKYEAETRRHPRARYDSVVLTTGSEDPPLMRVLQLLLLLYFNFWGLFAMVNHTWPLVQHVENILTWESL